MNIKDLNLDQTAIEYLKITDIDNFFNVYVDKKKNYIYNLNNTVYLDVKDDSLLDFVVTYDSFWPTISYKLYNTTRLAWMLMKINDVKPSDIFKQIEAGSVIKYINKEYVKGLVKTINNY